MKRILLVGLTIVVLSLLTVFTIPVFAHGPTEGDSGTPDQETWQAMHEACEDGDWDAMTEAAEEAHGEYSDDMPCHGYGYEDSEQDARVSPGGWGRMGDHMDGDMMHGGSSGMMDLW